VKSEVLPAALLLTAAGSSSRFLASSAQRQKKEYADIAGVPVLLHALEPFLRISTVRNIVITCPAGDEEVVTHLLQDWPLAPLLENRFPFLVSGGSSRQASVLAGLEALEGSGAAIVLIHDGARPWITKEVIERVMHGVEEHGAAIPVAPSTSAMKMVDESGKILRHLPRSQTVEAQTPQGFRFPEILTAHRKVFGDGKLYIDDAEVYDKVIGPVFTVDGDPNNRKITYRSDLS
jgi:2-C-methyl-D-erythritol 4-phosphate cytidylyltransferase